MKQLGKLWIVAVMGLVVGVLGGTFAQPDGTGRTFQDRSYCFGTNIRC